MKIFVKAKPKHKKPYVRPIDTDHFEVAVSESPIRGKANSAVIKALAEYFKLAPTSVNLVSGETSNQKIFVLPLTEDEVTLLLKTR